MAISFVFDSERVPFAEFPGALVVRCPQCDGAVMSNSVINLGLVEVDGEVRAVPMLVQPSRHLECEHGHVTICTDTWRVAVEVAADGLSSEWSREVDPAVEGLTNLRLLPERPDIGGLPGDVA